MMNKSIFLKNLSSFSALSIGSLKNRGTKA